MTNGDLKAGREVYLSATHGWEYGNYNPLTCVGTTEDFNQYDVGVRWANGNFNTYNTDANDLIPKIQPSRDAARAAARRNPNLTVKKIDDQWVLELKQKLVINDGGNK